VPALKPGPKTSQPGTHYEFPLLQKALSQRRTVPCFTQWRENLGTDAKLQVDCDALVGRMVTSRLASQPGHDVSPGTKYIVPLEDVYNKQRAIALAERRLTDGGDLRVRR
jgi:hypothetical protein